MTSSRCGSRSRPVLGTIFVAVALAFATPSQAGNVEDARAALSKGKRLLQSGQFEESKQSYEAAAAICKKASKNERRQLFREERTAHHNLKIFDVLKAVEGAPLKDGQYRGSANGYNGPVAVAVTVANGRIAAVAVVQSRESRPKNAPDAIPRQILAQQSVLVDAVSGATVTSNAVREATARALLQAVGTE